MPETVVEWKPRPRNRVFIKLSGGRFFTIPDSETVQLEAGTVLSDEEIEKLARVDQYFRGKEKALRLLSVRPRTRHEIKNALMGLEVVPAIRDGIIGELEENGLIDDARFSREYVRSKIELKGLGPHRLRFELKKLGVRAGIVDDTLQSEFTDEGQEEIAWRVVRGKLRERKPDEKDVRRLSALLRRKGMDYEVINRVTYQLLQESRIEDTLD
jgi:regulatory protein